MLMNAFPAKLRYDIQKVVGIMLEQKTYSDLEFGWTKYGDSYLLSDESIVVPYRIYYKEIPDTLLSEFSDVQMSVYHCLYSRSCDGFVRQRHVRALLESKLFDWVYPYIVKISDEYLIEIVQDVYDALRQQDTGEIKEFCKLNEKSFQSGHSRMVSYWDAYYRKKHPNLCDYVGEKLFKDCFGYTRQKQKK